MEFIQTVMETILGLVCHQIPERSLDYGGSLFPLCARCAGLYMGTAVTGIWLLFHAAMKRKPWIPLDWAALSCLIAVFCIIDAISCFSYSLGLGNHFRFLLGYGGGLGMASVFGVIMTPFFPQPLQDKHQKKKPRIFLIVLLSLPVLALFIKTGFTGKVLVSLDVIGLIFYRIAIVVFLLRAISYCEQLLINSNRKIFSWGDRA